ncbi:hypothetical protein [Thiosulfativibrio zosterae]|uniref:hypothetical protein n=1 Tax=Thiosulfativibrio zosterae TaxID=2675053 RepID=UPI0015654B87|nr:hypothetical protein [Thiosulfativibrio zosterae]
MRVKHLKNQNKAQKLPKNNQAWLFLVPFWQLLSVKNQSVLPLILPLLPLSYSGIRHPQPINLRTL